MNSSLTAARLLLAQSRYDLAEEKLREALGEAPTNPEVHAFLALCLAEQEKNKPEALEHAQQAVGLAPDSDLCHYVLATVLHVQDKNKEALAAIQEAIRLDPEDADNFSRLAAINLDLRKWPDALAAAEQGLALEPEHIGCNNIRAMALVKLGRRAEAGATIAQALQRDPDNAITHANKGWTDLEHGDHKTAMLHFREALRIDPTLDWARAGIVEALRARHFLYRLILKYFFFMSRLSNRAQWAVIIGLWIAYRLLRTIARENPDAAPYVYPFLGAYLIFVFLTWMARPLLNLLLRFNSFGRLALSDDEIRASNWVGGLLAAGVILLILWPTTGSILFLPPAVYCLLMMLPINATLSTRSESGRRKLLIYTIGLAILGPAAFAALFVDKTLGMQLGVGFLLGWLAFTWFANYVHMRT